MAFKFKLGDRVKEPIIGATGFIMAQTEHFASDNIIKVAVGNQGAMVDFEESALVLLGEEVVIPVTESEVGSPDAPITEPEAPKTPEDDVITPVVKDDAEPKTDASAPITESEPAKVDASAPITEPAVAEPDPTNVTEPDPTNKEDQSNE